MFGADGDSVFDHLDALSTALRAGDTAGISAAVDVLEADAERITDARADVGARTAGSSRPQQARRRRQLSADVALSEVENIDLAKATVDLSAGGRLPGGPRGHRAGLQPSLLDFLR